MLMNKYVYDVSVCPVLICFITINYNIKYLAFNLIVFFIIIYHELSVREFHSSQQISHESFGRCVVRCFSNVAEAFAPFVKFGATLNAHNLTVRSEGVHVES